jgi:ADP-ribose pyrophosphatase YjhB (NUDIX family)
MTEHAVFSSGAGVLNMYNDKVLLVQMNYGKYIGHWILPGGMVEPGEHPHVAAIRECKEETGLDVKTTQTLCVRTRLTEKRPGNIYWVYIGEILTKEPENKLVWPKEEIQCARFWPIEKCLNDEMVRQHTKNYIKMALATENLEPIEAFDGPYNDFVYRMKNNA